MFFRYLSNVASLGQQNLKNDLISIHFTYSIVEEENQNVHSISLSTPGSG